MLPFVVCLVTVSCALAQESQPDPMTPAAALTTTQEATTVTMTSESPPPPPPPPSPSNVTSGSPPGREKEGRALNMTLPPLDDVTMEDEISCTAGQVIDRGCNQLCQCVAGTISCAPRQCPAPLVLKGTNTDPLCQESQEGSDPCCVILVCSHTEAESKSSDVCVYKNETYPKGDTFNDACEAVCSCESPPFVSCKPRCPAMNNTKSEKCLSLPDAKDPCCTRIVCDVSLDDHASETDENEEVAVLKLVSATPVNSSAVSLEFSTSHNSSFKVETSLDGSIWSPTTADGLMVGSLQGGKTYSFRVKSGNTVSNIVQATLPASMFLPGMCEYKGKNYTSGEEFHDGCASYCICGKSGVECASIDCPTNFGLDVLDPHCLSWETQPADFVPIPPKCCPETVKCKDNGSCEYKGERFPNWADIPTKLSGCEQRCYCEMGNVTCHATCPPVPDKPPTDLACSSKDAILTHQPDDDCCLFWMCPAHSGTHLDMKPTETNTMNNKTDSTITDTTTSLPPPLLGPYSPNYSATFTPKNKPNKNQTNNKKDYFPGPFSLQHLDEEVRKGQQKQKPDNQHKTKPHKENPLVDILAPFHLPASEIPDIHPTTKTKSGQKQPDIELEDHEHDVPDTNEGLFANFPFLSPPLTKPSKHDKDKSKPTYEGPKQHSPFHLEENDSTYPGLFKPSKSPDVHQPNGNKSSFAENSISRPSQGDREVEEGRPPSYGPVGDHEFQYVGGKDPSLPIEHGGHHLNPDQLYFIHNQGFSQHPSQSDKPNQDIYNVQHFQIPFDPSIAQQHNIEAGPPRFNKKKPINKHQNDQLLPQEILTHLHSLAPHLPKGGQIPPNLHPEEILHYVQPNPQLNAQQQHPPAHYLTPEEIFLYQNSDKPPVDGKIPQPHNVPHQNIPSPGRDTIHIHSPSIPTSPSQRVEEILAHLRHQDPNQYPGQHFPPHHPGAYQESLLTQHSSHAALPIGLPPGPNITHPGFNNNLPITGFPHPPGNQDPNEIKVHTLEAINDQTVRLIFSVPNVLVGLHGRVELRYTSDRQNSDPATWRQQVLAPPDDLIATPELEFELGDLEPNTTYKIRIAITLNGLANSPSSDILTVKTLPRLTTTSYPPEITVNPELRIAELNATWVKLVWRKFSDFELQFIDGVQLLYKEPHAQVFSATPLIHRAVTSYIIEDLKPDTLYQVGLYFIPFPNQTTELRSQENLEITTAIEDDPYSFDLVVDVHHVKASSVELMWSGVPYPEDKYINIFRAIYQSEGEREDFSSFKVAKRDSPPNTLIQGLKPNTRYHLWLEAYLTNGRIKKSNVKDFTTKAGVASASDSLQGKLEATPLVEKSDYYGALVGVSILATLAIAAVVILSLILARKHGHNKAPITAANNRKAQSAAYDNPSYKVEIQQETMDL